MADTRIKDITTAATASDIAAGNYFVLDTPNGTKKLGGNLVAKKSDVADAESLAFGNLKTLASDIGEWSQYGIDIDASVLTDGRTFSDVFFERSNTLTKPSIVRKIKVLEMGGAYSLWKVKVNESAATATCTKLFELNGGVERQIKEIDCNVTLEADEYIGIKGNAYYKSYVTTTENYSSVNSSGAVVGTTVGILGLTYEGVNSSLLDYVGNVDTTATSALSKAGNNESSIGIISDVIGKVTDGGSISLSRNHTTKTNVFWAKNASVKKVYRVTKIKLAGVSNPCSLYKVTENGTTATYIKIADIGAGVDYYDCDITLNENQYIGIDGSFKYSNGVAGQYKYCYMTNGDSFATTNSGTISLEVEGYPKMDGKEVNVYVVGKDSSADYTCIRDALIGTYGKDSESNPITIRVKAGIYDEPAMEGSFNPYCIRRYLSIVGDDKINCIIRNKNGYYYPGVQDNSCIKVAGNVYIANLTLISLCTEYAEPSGTEYTDRKASYCIHVDSYVGTNHTTEINNCIMVNDHCCCVGIGIKQNHKVKIVNCEMKSTFDKPDYIYGGATIYAHDANEGSTGVTEEFLTVKNCIIESTNSNRAIKVYCLYGKNMECEFVGNTLSYNDGGEGAVLSATAIKKKTCFGNNVALLNA